MDEPIIRTLYRGVQTFGIYSTASAFVLAHIQAVISPDLFPIYFSQRLSGCG
jgi:hypothetical protein